MTGKTQGSAGAMPDTGADRGRRSFTSPDNGGSWRVLDTADEVYPGRAHDDHDLDDYDELLKVTNISLHITPCGMAVEHKNLLAMPKCALRDTNLGAQGSKPCCTIPGASL